MISLSPFLLHFFFRVWDDEKLAGNWLDLAEGNLRSAECNFSWAFRTLGRHTFFPPMEMSRSRRLEVQKSSSCSRDWKIIQSSKNKMIFYWLIFRFGDTNCLAIFGSTRPWLRLHHVLFLALSAWLPCGNNSPEMGETNARFTTWKSKICNHKHLWHLGANRGAHEMITNCDRNGKFLMFETQYHDDARFLWGIEAADESGMKREEKHERGTERCKMRGWKFMIYCCLDSNRKHIW